MLKQLTSNMEGTSGAKKIGGALSRPLHSGIYGWAPRGQLLGDESEVLARSSNGETLGVRQGRFWGGEGHPAKERGNVIPPRTTNDHNNIKLT